MHSNGQCTVEDNAQYWAMCRLRQAVSTHQPNKEEAYRLNHKHVELSFCKVELNVF